MKRCFLYPGQGAQYTGMGKDLFSESSAVREVFSEASDESGIDLEQVLFNGSDEDLLKTENTQVAVTVVNLAAMTYLGERGVESDACAGFSLGEYSSLVDSRVLARSVAFKLVRKRGEIMAKASSGLTGGPAGMAAVIGLDFEEASVLLDQLKDDDIYLANHSSPSQIVIAGTDEALEKADKLFEDAGALSFIRMKVSGPFHSPLMASARDEMAEYLKDIDFRDPVKPVFANVTGDKITSGDEARRLCIEQIVSPVRWVAIEEKLVSMGFDQVLEVGPGNVLSGLWKSYTKALRCLPAGTSEAIMGLQI
ncbi:MAG: [acyl-carrier-protein] S-malonyltransferase [Spirochaetales bacterium]|nr:MAG: [acyl-carrier-protein] S-malonyltransferase [Spirochaetales bacterium]